MLFSLLSRWIYSGESSCKLYRGYVSFCLCRLLSKCVLNPHIAIALLWMSVLLCCASCQACADPETLKSCGDWLKGSVLGGQLLGLTEELCSVGHSAPISASSTSNHSWKLISLVLSQHHNNGEMKQSHTSKHFCFEKYLFLDFLIRHQSI